MTNIANKIRRGILAYVHDYPGTDKWDVLEEVCPDRKKTGFNILKGLMNEGLIQMEIVHDRDGPVRYVRFALTLTNRGILSMGECA